jgi:hypothetical protein
MRRAPRGNKVQASDKSQNLRDLDGVWSDQDNEALQKLLDPLRSTPKIDPLGMLGSEARGLVCAPPREVYDRAMSYLTTMNVCAGLVLNSIASLATDPVKVHLLPQDKQLLGDTFNVLAYISITTQICVVMFSTYILFMLAVHAHSPAQVYRALAHSGAMFGVCQIAIYLPLLLWCVMLIISGECMSRVFWTCHARTQALSA